MRLLLALAFCVDALVAIAFLANLAAIPEGMLRALTVLFRNSTFPKDIELLL